MTTEPTALSLLDDAPAASCVERRTGGCLNVSVVYARPEGCWQVALTVPDGTDVGTAIRLSGFDKAFPKIAETSPAVGIFGRRCRRDEILSEGDRIEIYRPLTYDPMESRRRRAAHRKAAATKGAFRPRRVRNGISS